MSVRSLQYFKKFGAVNQKTAKFAIFFVSARFRLRIMRMSAFVLRSAASCVVLSSPPKKKFRKFAKNS